MPLVYSELTKEEFDAMMQKSIDSANAGNVTSAEIVHEAIRRRMGK
jgi:hypothetical protein